MSGKEFTVLFRGLSDKSEELVYLSHLEQKLRELPHQTKNRAISEFSRFNSKTISRE